MKTVLNFKTGEISREQDSQARKLVASGDCKYIPKEIFKRLFGKSK